jgi:hypothetical protein
MTDGDYYRTYANTRLACGSLTTTLCSDAEMDILQLDADALIHEYLDVTSKQSTRPNILAKIETDLVFQGVVRLRLAKEQNLINLEFIKTLRTSATQGEPGVMDLSPQLTKAHEKMLDIWLENGALKTSVKLT